LPCGGIESLNYPLEHKSLAHANKTTPFALCIETKHAGQQITINQTKISIEVLEFNFIIHKTCWEPRVKTIEKEEHKTNSQVFHTPKHN
jgi:hypothetical protein